MAILKKGDGNIEITNGDLVALKKIAGEYSLSDESDVIAFAIGVLDLSKGLGVKVATDAGLTTFMPSDRLRDKTPTESATT